MLDLSFFGSERIFKNICSGNFSPVPHRIASLLYTALTVFMIGKLCCWGSRTRYDKMRYLLWDYFETTAFSLVSRFEWFSTKSFRLHLISLKWDCKSSLEYHKTPFLILFLSRMAGFFAPFIASISTIVVSIYFSPEI